MNTLINSIYESKEEVRIELIDLMSEEVITKKGLILGDLSRVFIMISQMLNDINKQVILSTHKLIAALIDFLLPAEIESGLKLFQNQLIQNLADSDRQIRKSTKAVFLSFISKTRNGEQVLEVLSGSFSNRNFYIRERAINLVPDIFAADKSIFCNRTGINEVRKIMECVIIHLNDVNESVQKICRKVIRNIRNIEGFELVYRRLAVEHQNVIDKIQREMPPRVDKFIELNIQIQEYAEQIIDEFVPSDFLSKPNYNLEDFPKDLQNKLYFGFLSKNILQDTLNQKDLAVREKGVGELNSLFFEDSEEELSINSRVIDRIVKGGFMPSFFKYVSSLFTCQEYRIVNMLLNIIGKIMQVPGIHVNVYLPLCLPGLIQCLKDERVVIRQRSLFLLKQMIKYFRKKQYFQNLIYFIDQQMDNWHQKEELINLISYLVLSIQPTESWFYIVEEKQPDIKQENTNQTQEQIFNLREVDFKKSLVSIANYLNDPIAKVKFAALECLSVMAYLDRRHLQYLHEAMNQQVYDKMNDKVENGIVYFINDNGNLELPQFHIKKMEEQRESFIQKQSIVESVIVEEKPKTPSESEQSEESKFKVTYYYDKFPMSLNDKIIKSNASIDSLFASEHKNNQGTKYDMIIPIGQFSQTKANEQFKLINSNVYLEKQRQQQDFHDDEILSSEEEQLESIEFEYPTRTLKYRGHPPEQITQSKYQPIDDVKSRVYNTIKQLNEDINVDLQIPKVIKANVGAYQGYKYEEPTSFQDDDEEIFIDTKQIKQQHKPLPDAVQQSTQQTIEVNTQDNKIQQVQEILKQQQLIYTPEQRFQKRLEEFLLSFENRDIKQKGKNARKLKRKLKETTQSEELPNVFDMPVRIDNARAETAALLVNFSALDLELLSVSLHKFKVLLQNHLTDVYASQVPLLQLINDICRILSTQNDNPLYAIDYSKYKRMQPQTLVRKIVFIAMQTLSVAVQTLRTSLVEVQKMFSVCGVWLQDENKQVSQQAEQTMLDIVRFCDDSQLSEILPKLYHKNSFNSKIYVGVLIEHLVIKYAKGIFKSNHFNSILQIISQMVIDQSFDVRRIGKKVFFKILTFGSYQVDDIIMEMHQQEKQQMKELLKRYEELINDHQIGIFDQDEYMGLQAVPQQFGFEYEMIDDQLYMN